MVAVSSRSNATVFLVTTGGSEMITLHFFGEVESKSGLPVAGVLVSIEKGWRRIERTNGSDIGHPCRQSRIESGTSQIGIWIRSSKSSIMTFTLLPRGGRVSLRSECSSFLPWLCPPSPLSGLLSPDTPLL